MKNSNNRSLFSLFILSFLLHTTILAHTHRSPRLTVILIVDQCAYSYFNKLAPHFKYGLKFLLGNGVNFTNTHMPHGQPGTAAGHAGHNTGTEPCKHGFVSNAWYDPDGKKIACDDDHSGNAHVFAPDGTTYDYGKSSHMLMVDGLSDQCVLQSEPRSNFAAYSISLKSRSAIATASKLGKPLWLDGKSGFFTSSKAYFDKLPSWVNHFNRTHTPSRNGTFVWRRFYQKSPYSYNFFNINNYQFTRDKETMMNKHLPYWDESNPKNPRHLFEKSPFANELILDCAQECIKNHVSRRHRDRLLLWVCLGPLDKVGHQYGPDSMEAIDMLYHLDKQLQQFIRGIYRTIGKHEVAFVLTADHGIMPIPELLKEQGLTMAQRIDRDVMIKKINDNLDKNCAVQGLAIAYKGQELMLDKSKMDQLWVDQLKYWHVINNIKQDLLQEPGIKRVWTFDELAHTCTTPNSIEDYIKNQLYKGRSGEIVVQPEPYTVITHWQQGAAHKSPYNYDTHIPLILFYPGRFERKTVRQRVVALQLANTLAELLHVPKPSASMYDILPELFDPEYK